jgi:hypothetical protein
LLKTLEKDKKTMAKLNKYLSFQRILTTYDQVAVAGHADKAEFCLIGGAAFVLHAVKGYKTKDLDFAANKDLSDGLLKPVDDPNAFSWNENGHFQVDGVKVDWIFKLSDGTKKLFELAVKYRISKCGCWVSKMCYAVAIRIAAGRNKDIRMFKKFVRDGIVDAKQIHSILKRHAPNSRGFEWMKTSHFMKKALA